MWNGIGLGKNTSIWVLNFPFTLGKRLNFFLIFPISKIVEILTLQGAKA